MPRSTISAVPASFQFKHELRFEPDRVRELMREIPEQPGIVALFGADPSAQPYLTRTADLRRRVRRLVDPPAAVDGNGRPLASKRLNLRDRVVHIGWTETGSEFESLLLLYNATSTLFGAAEARRRLKLHTPTFVRLTFEHAQPRLYTTNRLSRAALAQLYGPFPSRLAAERYCDAILDLFRLRRCHEDLQVYPDHPGCAYGEMKRCMSPCNMACSAEEYEKECNAVRAFLDTHGESLLSSIAVEREAASDAMDFERAAELHGRWEKVKAAAALADPLTSPIPQLRAIVVQRAAPCTPWHETTETQVQDELAALVLLRSGRLIGPEPMSTLGVRAVREQTSVGSSLFAQPLMLHAVPLGSRPDAAPIPAESPEARAEAVLATLECAPAEPDMLLLSDHLSLFRRWYYRPEKQREGEVLLPNPDGSWPVRKLLRAAARAVLGDPKPMQATDRDSAKSFKTKVLHAGRPEVARIVPDLASVAVAETLPAPVFRSRRGKRERT